MSEPAIADRLYGLPLEDFTAERDAAARELRRGGDRDAAAELAKLPKPSAAAWAANQVAREQPELLHALLEAGESLRRAQEDVLAGEGGAALREAAAAERRAVDAFAAAAAELRPAGRPLSRAMTDRLRTTLHAAAADERIRDALAAGRLVAEAEAGGAWPLAAPGAEPPARPRRDRRPAKRDAAQREPAEMDAVEREAAEREAAEREAAEREAAALRRELEEALEDARSRLRAQERMLARAERHAERTHERLERALAAADEAQADADAAKQALEEAREAVSGSRDDVARLEESLD